MGAEYFSRFEDALAIITSEQSARDLQEFVIAISFFKRFDHSTFTGRDEVLKAIIVFKTFLQPIKVFGIDAQIHADIRERATALSAILDKIE